MPARTITVLGLLMAAGALEGSCRKGGRPFGAVSVAVIPRETAVDLGGTVAFQAVVTGATLSDVTWSVPEANGGTVDASGHYTAPAAEGTYHVVATSVADATKSDTATVSVSTVTIIPLDRRTKWNPGLNAVGGIPDRTAIFRTLSPSGGDDTAAIQDALNACPANQVVKLDPGTFNINGNGLIFRTSRCTLRGSGTGTPGSGAGGTRLVKADRATNANAAILTLGYGPGDFSSSIDLATDAVKGNNSVTLVSNPGLQVGEFVLIDHVTTSDPQVFWGTHHDPPGGGSRRWFCRQDRSLSQVMEIASVDGTSITFVTPFHATFKTSYAAQLSRYGQWAGGPLQPFIRWSGIEDIYFHGGMGGDYHGNISMNTCAFCWVKNIESNAQVGTAVGMYGTYRSEVRDSYIHSTADPNPGGGGYLTGMAYGAADNLLENNVIWNGNKMIVMRATGGGNVIGYNYLEDGWGSSYPTIPEVGLNASHFTTPHMELLEGNRAWNYDSDSFWGNSIQITIFRNHLTGLRGAFLPLAIGDLFARRAASLNWHSYQHNFVGNVLGTQGQVLIPPQTGWMYEATSSPATAVPMWQLGYIGENPSAAYDSQVPATTLRDGNWDWYTQSMRWHGTGGAPGSGIPRTIPDSLYLSGKPAFFGSNTWPWVDPNTGAVYTLPAKARFDAMPSH